MIQRISHHSSIIFLTFVFIVAMTSCSTVEVGIEKTNTPNVQLTEFISNLSTQNAILATQIAIPTLPATATATNSIPLLTSPTLPPPMFSNLRFSPDPETMLARRFYVEGTPRIFSIWDYSGMQEGMIVRREWKRNDENWVTREEPWDYAKYGGDGTVQDIFVFDDEVGLEAGKYSLTLYIDGVSQDPTITSEMNESNTFWIFDSDITAPLASPDKSHTAFVRFGGNLFIEDPNGENREIAKVQEITDLAWFPDGRYLLYVERDRTKQLEPTTDKGVTHRIFNINIDTLEQNIIGTIGENFHSPLISPNGIYIAVLSGAQFRDGCTGSPNLAIIELDLEHRRQAIHQLNSFSGLEFPNDNTGTIILATADNSIVWQNDTHLLVNLTWLCKPPNSNPDGHYILNMSTKTAERGD